MIKRLTIRNADNPSEQSWSDRLHALGTALDAQKAELHDLCVLDLLDGYVVHATCRSNDGSSWNRASYEFTVGDLATKQRLQRAR